MAVVSSKSFGTKREITLNEGDRVVLESRVDLDELVLPGASGGNAVSFGVGGYGEIGHWQIESKGSGVDAVRLTGGAQGPFTVHSGSLTIYKREPTSTGALPHQDGIQAGGGRDFTFARQVIQTLDTQYGSTQGV